MTEFRAVIDTNVMVSAVLRPNSIPRQALDLALARGVILASEATILELDEVFHRPKFEKYVSQHQRLEFLAALVREAELVRISVSLSDCRDPKDNKFLELAVSGSATHMLTGDDDLLELHPFRSVSILTPQSFLAAITGAASGR